MPIGKSSAPAQPTDTVVLSQGSVTSTAGVAVENVADISIPTALGYDNIVIIAIIKQASGVAGATTFGLGFANNAIINDPQFKCATDGTIARWEIIRHPLTPDTKAAVISYTDAAWGIDTTDGSFEFNAAEHIYINVQQVAAKTYTIRWTAYRIGPSIKG